MKLEIRFICTQCWYSTNKNSWIHYEWYNLREVLEHLRHYPNHDIEAETEFSL